MANNGVITIKFVEGSKKVPGPQAINDKQDAEQNDNTLETAVMASLIQRAAKQIKGMVIGEAKYQLNMHFKMTDNYLGAQNMNIALDVINKAWSTGLSIFTGAKIGFKAGGPMGAAFGAVLMAGVSAISISQQISHNYEQERIRINQMNANLQFNRQRAGYSLTAGSIGENR